MQLRLKKTTKSRSFWFLFLLLLLRLVLRLRHPFKERTRGLLGALFGLRLRLIVRLLDNSRLIPLQGKEKSSFDDNIPLISKKKEKVIPFCCFGCSSTSWASAPRRSTPPRPAPPVWHAACRTRPAAFGTSLKTLIIKSYPLPGQW